MESARWHLKTFDELSNKELYGILRLRNSIFVVDQQCIFEEIDGKDQVDCHHFFCALGNQVLAYARVLGPGVLFKEPCISRVCTSLNHRSKGMGKKLMQRVLEETSRLYPEQSIRISAQFYLKKFYEDFGFQTTGDIYLEDGIEHIQMHRKV